MLDALAMERQFIDHLLPVWRALTDPVRGTFLVDPELVSYAESRGLAVTASPRPIRHPAYPPPRFDGPPLLVASYGDVKVGRRLGYGPFVFIEHGAGQTYNGDRDRSRISGSYSGGIDRDDNELVLVPNEHAAAAWRRAYPAAHVEIVGSPRLETLQARQPGPGPVVAISFHWDAPMGLGAEAGSAIGDYAPVLPELATRLTMIGHAHPKGDWPKRMERIYARAGIEFVAEFDEVCRRADVYVCDNSSTLFEFAATGRPVVVLNSSRYRKHVHHGLRFWEAADVGIQVDEPPLLAAAIVEALADAPQHRESREHALSIVYAFRTGASERAASAIARWLTGRQGQAQTRADLLAVS
jgi:hypothetical protein